MEHMGLWDGASQAVIERVESGNAALIWLAKYESIERWLQVGQMLDAIRQQAIRVSNKDSGKGYNAAWKALADERAPKAHEMNKATRSHAMWLATNWDEVNDWRTTLPANDQMKLVHPTTIRQHYMRAHRPETLRPPKPKQPMPSLIELMHSCPEDELIGAIRELYPQADVRLSFDDKIRATAVIDEIATLIARDETATEEDRKVRAVRAEITAARIMQDAKKLLPAIASAVAAATAATKRTDTAMEKVKAPTPKKKRKAGETPPVSDETLASGVLDWLNRVNA